MSDQNHSANDGANDSAAQRKLPAKKMLLVATFVIALSIAWLLLSQPKQPTVSSPPNRRPVADFEYSPKFFSQSSSTKIDFVDMSIDSDDDLLTHKWYIDGSLIGTGRSCSAALQPGKHNVRLVVSDGRAEDSVERVVSLDPEQVYPLKKLGIPLKGVNYLIGRKFTGDWGRPPDDAEAEEALRIIRNELGCNAIKLVGDYEDRMIAIAEKSIRNGFKLIVLSLRHWKTSPTEDMHIDEHIERVVAFSKKAEELRKRAGNSSIVLCVGEELEIAIRGIGTSDTYLGRIEEHYGVISGDERKWEQQKPYVERQLNVYLKRILDGVRRYFRGDITYSPSDATRHLVKWNELQFDIVGPMVYYSKKWETEKSMLLSLAELKKYGKPLHVMEFGCATFKGASTWGGGGWLFYRGEDYSEEEQAQSIADHIKIFERAGVDAIFLYSFLEPASDPANCFAIMRSDASDRAARKLGFYMYKSYAVSESTSSSSEPQSSSLQFFGKPLGLEVRTSGKAHSYAPNPFRNLPDRP